MAQATFHCPRCKKAYPVRAANPDKLLHCRGCGERFRLERIDDYVLLGELGRGTFGVVYSAYDLRNDREVALKLLNEKDIPQDEFDSWADRAVAEAKALAKIDHHPNVLPLFNSGKVGRKFYLVTPVIRGRTLDKVIPEHGFPDPLQAAQMGATILRALHHVHKFKIYHRDVKPSNIMIDADDHLFLVDFGLAASREVNAAVRTEVGTVLGTPAYMPLEQARGEVHRVGPWSDQYGAGAVLFKMLTGSVPYPGERYAVLGQVADYHKPPRRPSEFRPDLDPELEALVLRSLEKYPGKRFSSCAEFADALQTWADACKARQVPPQAAPVAPASAAAGTRAPHSRWVVWLIVAVIVAALAGGGWVIWQAAQTPPAPTFIDPKH